MAKNISLLGADYPDVPAVQLPRTGGGAATFYDIEVTEATGLYSGVRAYKTGNVVQISFEGFSAESSYSANETLFTLPQGYRPLYPISFLDTLNSGRRISVSSTGAVCCTSAMSSGTLLRGGCAFIV